MWFLVWAEYSLFKVGGIKFIIIWDCKLAVDIISRFLLASINVCYNNFVWQVVLLNVGVYGILYSLLVLHDLFYEHFRLVFGVIALSDDSMILGVVDTFDASLH